MSRGFAEPCDVGRSAGEAARESVRQTVRDQVQRALRTQKPQTEGAARTQAKAPSTGSKNRPTQAAAQSPQQAELKKAKGLANLIDNEQVAGWVADNIHCGPDPISGITSSRNGIRIDYDNFIKFLSLDEKHPTDENDPLTRDSKRDRLLFEAGKALYAIAEAKGLDSWEKKALDDIRGKTTISALDTMADAINRSSVLWSEDVRRQPITGVDPRTSPVNQVGVLLREAVVNPGSTDPAVKALKLNLTQVLTIKSPNQQANKPIVPAPSRR